ncbi:peroxin-19 [Strigomonas culicis]|uniref:Peroxin-19 n=1 Tax=Strigomonas culicis TaxID=28005 RepID=S9UFR1_9TRYP|nr:peroxin-19 [Strigomonas culicis]|eukprot:EPY27753.1 peroxin-19 [Strigomonas culicis]
MDIVDEQDQKTKTNDAKEKQKLDSDIEKTLDELEGNSAKDILNMFQPFVDAMASGDMSEDAVNNMKKAVGDFFVSVEDGSNTLSNFLSTEDRKELDRLREMMNAMESNDDAKAQQMLADLQRDKPHLANMDDFSKVGFASAQEYEEVMRKLSETLGQSSEATAAAVQEEGAASENVTNMLLSTILDPQFVEPLKLMRDAYAPWLEAHLDLSEVDRSRYTQQCQKATEICDFLRVPVDKEDTERVEKLLHLMSEFSDLGEPPQDLTSFAHN